MVYVLYYINNTSVPWVAEAWQLSGPRLSTPSCSWFGLKGSAGGSQTAGVMTITMSHTKSGGLPNVRPTFGHTNVSFMIYYTHKTASVWQRSPHSVIETDYEWFFYWYIIFLFNFKKLEGFQTFLWWTIYAKCYYKIVLSSLQTVVFWATC